MRRPGCLIQKDPNSIEPYGFDWTDYLSELDAAETITSSTWAVTPSGVTLSSPSIVTGSKKTQVKCSGGTAGTRYTVKNSIVTSSGYADDRSFYFLGVEK